jgi:hypothetical protein
MTLELQQKMQEKFNKITFEFPNMENEEMKSQIIKAVEGVFMAGAEDMYSELAPLVEWVDVGERLPENSDNEQNIIVKLENGKISIAPYFRNNRFWSLAFCEIPNVKFWKLC